MRAWSARLRRATTTHTSTGDHCPAVNEDDVPCRGFLVRRTTKSTGDPLLGCRMFPRCRFTCGIGDLCHGEPVLVVSSPQPEPLQTPDRTTPKSPGARPPSGSKPQPRPAAAPLPRLVL